MTSSRLRPTQGCSQEPFAQAAGLNRAYIAEVERGQSNVGVVNLYWIPGAFG